MLLIFLPTNLIKSKRRLSEIKETSKEIPMDTTVTVFSLGIMLSDCRFCRKVKISIFFKLRIVLFQVVIT